MNKAILIGTNGKREDTIPLDSPAFNEPLRERLIHQVVVAKLSSSHQGTAKAKTRAEVAGSGKKPYKQKGTGRARVGSIRSPVWRGGGVTFGPQPRSRKKNVNKKSNRTALFSILSQKAKLENIYVVDNFPTFERPLTRGVVEWVDEMNLSRKKVLLVDSRFDRTLYLSLRNIKNLFYTHTGQLNILEVIQVEKIVFSRESLNKWNEFMEKIK